MATFKQPSDDVLAARARSANKNELSSKRTEWFINEVSDKVVLSIKQRVTVATELVQSKTISNISRPVTKGTGPRGGRVVTNRSQPGEFPKADTTQLLKTIFSTVTETSPGVWDGFVGTPLSYGLILENRMKRSFLKRTLNEQLGNIRRILTGPIR